VERRVSWDRGPSGNWRHIFVEHPERKLTETEIEEILLSRDSLVVERRPPCEAVVGRIAGTGRLLLVAYIPRIADDALEMFPVHARQISARTWRRLRATVE